MITIKTDENLVSAYNFICKKHLRSSSTLSDLSDNELSIYIAGRSYGYGRPLQASLENANIHMQNREKAIKCFSKRETDLLGFNA